LAGDAGWWTYQRYFNRDLRITFLSVGEGDGAVVRFPGSRVMVIDGGGGFRGVFDPGERIVAPYLWANKIMHVDYLTVSHPDRDHFGGLIYIAQNFSPSEFWTGGTSSDDEAYVQLMDAVRKSGARQRICDAFSAPMVISGVTVRCIGPIDENSEVKQNNASMVIRLAYDHSSVLFTGDIEAKAERELLASGANLHSTVLKVPHHGSNTSSTAGFIETVRPRLAVISLGYDNRFHFPAPDVLQRYHDEAVPVLRTDEDGAIEVEIGPGGASVRSFTSGTLKLIR
jgi:competence protein ComEC